MQREFVSTHSSWVWSTPWKGISYDASFPTLGKRPHLTLSSLHTAYAPFPTLPLSRWTYLNGETQKQSQGMSSLSDYRISQTLCAGSQASASSPFLWRRSLLLCHRPGNSPTRCWIHPFLQLLPFQGLEELDFCNYFLLLLELIFKLQIVLCL